MPFLGPTGGEDGTWRGCVGGHGGMVVSLGVLVSSRLLAQLPQLVV